jgi:YD repeat-containing protein
MSATPRAALSRNPGIVKKECSRLTLPLVLLFICLFRLHVSAQDTVDATTLVGKYMCGYQGWFQCPGDGSGGGWFHWFNSQDPTHANLNVDLLPDFSEYDTSELFSTKMTYADGSTLRLNSSYRETTELRHFKWMKDYGIDGAWVQRFSPPQKGVNNFTNKVLLNCRKGAETYGRVFVVMYDISSSNNTTLFNDITSDWMYLVDSLKILESPRYLRHKGLPLLSVWGFGFTDRSMTADVALRIIKWFKTDAPAKYRVTFMGGVNDNWQTIAAPWDSVVRAPDIISPWFVGRFGDVNGADTWKTSHLDPDIAACKALGKEYLPVIWPGFSWSNMHQGTTPQNQIPRQGGAFFWRQAYNAIAAGSTMLYNAMFDEVDEGTAILKAATKRSMVPAGDYWLTLDADGYNNLPSDWYLRLAGYAKKMLAGNIPLSKTMPLNPNKPDSGLVNVSLQPATTGLQGCSIDYCNHILTISLAEPRPVTVSITTAQGRMVRQLRTGSGRLQRIRLYDGRIFSTGACLVRITDGRGMQYVKKVLAGF